MNLTRNCLKLSAVMLACAGALVGCGGGGSSSTPTQTTGGTTTPATDTTSTLVTSVPPATYTGDVASAFNMLNSERQNCGFGLLAQASNLDKAASAHSSYLVTNATFSHSEIKGLPGYTGDTPFARVTAAEYLTGGVGETIASSSSAAAGLRGLLAAPYHLYILLSGYRDVGIGFGPKYPDGTSPLVLDLAYRRGVSPQAIAKDAVLTYPCAGSTGVKPLLSGENPNPVPGRDLSNSPVGSPIMAITGGTSITITSASLIQTTTGQVVPLRAPINASSDPNGLANNAAFVLPESPLAANSQYQATLSGIVNGTIRFDRSFTFTTGN